MTVNSIVKAAVSAAILLLMAVPAFASGNDTCSPKASEKAVVTAGKARFTLLTDRLVRMEWSNSSTFEDRASLAIVNRNLPVPEYTSEAKDGKVTIRTGALTLTYTGQECFNPENLSVSFRMNGKSVTWVPGMDDSGNLLGTTRTLDGCKGFDQVSKRDNWMDKSVVSRDGWAIVDESRRHVLQQDDSDWGEWVAERADTTCRDLYIFAYGHDYKAAVADFIKVAGRIPLPPKYTFGYWWSRYWAYSDAELMDIAHEVRNHGIPMDVFIIDMDWHLTWKDMAKRLGRDEFGQARGWTGYSWNHDLIPDPEGLLADIHSLGFKTALNLHPASGIRPYEDCYDAMVEDYLSRTSDYDGPKGYVYDAEGYTFAGSSKVSGAGQPGHRAPVPYRMSQQAWADAYFNSVIHPLEKQGVDFWWLDWQQWRESKYVKDLSNTFWINYAFFNDKVRQGRSKGPDADRPLIYHRWGGLGSHRYQLGFSGDTYDEWSVLEFLPYFTATASNVGYGYWGHDIGGHMQMKTHMTDPEMYTRWLQYGVFTPIFKTHSTNSPTLERKIWAYPSHYEYMKAAIELRYALTPYIYTAAREAYDSGISICRPLYYSYPEDSRAYDMNQEFMFGDDILATALCQPMDSTTHRTERRMWFPAGNDWYDMAHHCTYRGGSEKTLYYSIDENPWYPKAGAVIPLAREGVQNLQENSDSLRILVVPGKGRSCCTVYEDDGMSQRYPEEYATTLIEKNATSGVIELTVNPRQGDFRGACCTRCLTLVLEGFDRLPASVTVNGRLLDASAMSMNGTAARIVLPQGSVSETMKVKVKR